MTVRERKFMFQKWKGAGPGIQAPDVSTVLCTIGHTRSPPNLIILRHNVTNQGGQVIRMLLEIIISQKGKFTIQKWKRAAPGIQAPDLSTVLCTIGRTRSPPNHILILLKTS